jgi:hypothetical protein
MKISKSQEKYERTVSHFSAISFSFWRAFGHPLVNISSHAGVVLI